jgi:L-ribulose-5-phosphate 4-epimerase
MKDEEIASEYEMNTGHAIIQLFKTRSYEEIPGVLVANHGPFAWGSTPKSAAHNAVLLEAIARTAYFTTTLNPNAPAIGRQLHDKHYLRKHGCTAYYGQPKDEE